VLKEVDVAKSNEEWMSIEVDVAKIIEK